jgi:two-component system response regulator
MGGMKKRIQILIAEDDLEDQMLIREAFDANGPQADLVMVRDGEELLDYLNARGHYANVSQPDLILLDLNMPRMDGREALAEIKRQSHLRHVPVVIFTTSSAPEDVALSYDLGGSSYICKPASYEGLLRVIGDLKNYWINVASLPRRAASGGEAL